VGNLIFMCEWHWWVMKARNVRVWQIYWWQGLRIFHLTATAVVVKAASKSSYVSGVTSGCYRAEKPVIIILAPIY
jgi:hypothetical protein